MWNKTYLQTHKLKPPKEGTDLIDPAYFGHLAISAPSRSGTPHLTIERLWMGKRLVLSAQHGKVKASTYLGSLVQYEVEVAGREKVKVNVVNPLKRAIFSEGERASLTFLAEDLVPIPLKA